MLQRIQQIDRRLLILFSIVPVGCLLAIVAGLVIGWVFFPAQMPGGQISNMSQEEIEDYIKTVAAEYAEDGDLEKARRVAEILGISNCIQQIDDNPSQLAEVSIIIGRDYERLHLLDP